MLSFWLETRKVRKWVAIASSLWEENAELLSQLDEDPLICWILLV